MLSQLPGYRVVMSPQEANVVLDRVDLLYGRPTPRPAHLYRPFDPSHDPSNTEVNHIQLVPKAGR